MVTPARDGDAVIRRVIGNGAWLFAANGASAGLLAIKGLIVARALGVDGFGVLGLVVTFVTVLSRLTSFRMNEFVIQYLSRSDASGTGDQQAVVKFSVSVEAAAALLAYGIVWLAAPIGARLVVRDPAAATLIRVYGAVILVGLVTETANGVLQAYGRFRTCSIATTCGAAAALAGTLVALAAGGGIPGVLMAMIGGALTSSATASVAALVEVRRRLGRAWWSAPLGGLAARWRSARAFVLSTNASATLSLVTRDADLVWLGLFRGPADAGLYRLASAVVSLVFIPTAPLAQSIYPEIAREAARKRWERLGHVLRRGSLLSAAYVVPVTLLVSVVSAPLIELLYGAPFAPAVPTLLILLIGAGFSNVFFWSRPALLALDRPDFPFKVNLALALLKIGAIFAIIPRFGHVGAAAVLAASYLAGVGLCAWKARQIVQRGHGRTPAFDVAARATGPGAA